MNYAYIYMYVSRDYIAYHSLAILKSVDGNRLESNIKPLSLNLIAIASSTGSGVSKTSMSS